MFRLLRRPFLAALGAGLLLALAQSARAVILLGSGDPAANTTAPAGALGDGGWNYVGRFGWSLGTAIGPHHFITAKHVGVPANDFIYQGKAYAIRGAVEDPVGDLRIFEIDGTFPSYAPLYTRGEELGRDLVLIGRGSQRGAPVFLAGILRGWLWGPGDSVLRWGENQVSAVNGTTFHCTFDAGRGPNECALSPGDSGGPAFVREEGVWKLAGINHAIDSSFAATASGPGLEAALFDGRGFFDASGRLLTGTAPAPTGFYSMRISSKLPWIQSVIAPALANISARAFVGAGGEVAIAGFIIEGDATQEKAVLLRGIGASLAVNGVPVASRLADPALRLHDDTGAVRAQNDDWQEVDAAAIAATGLAPGDAKEAAILARLRPGRYTVILSGAGGQSGLGLVEVYDLEPTGASRLTNLSTRARTGAGDNVLIGGIAFHSSTNALLLRALGPSLGALGVSGAMADPSLELRNSDGALVASNEAWQQDDHAAELQSRGLAPADPREAALLLRPAPGSYTAIVRAAGELSGVVLLEAFLVQP